MILIILLIWLDIIKMCMLYYKKLFSYIYNSYKCANYINYIFTFQISDYHVTLLSKRSEHIAKSLKQNYHINVDQSLSMVNEREISYKNGL